MPLNINTLGTGVSGSGSTDYVIPNSEKITTKLISSISNQKISSIAIPAAGQTANFRKEGQNTSYRREVTEYYDGYIYQIYRTAYDSSDYKFGRCRINEDASNTSMAITEISVPFPLDAFVGPSMIQLGDYLYIYAGDNTNYYDMKMLYRFDGTTFTALNTTKSPYEYFFNGTGAIEWGDNTCTCRIYPITTDEYDGITCLIDLYSYHDSKYPDGYTGVFTVDDDGFHLQKSYKISGYYSYETYFAPYMNGFGLLKTDTTFVKHTISSSKVYEETYSISYVKTQYDYYTRQITKTGSIQIATTSKSYKLTRYGRLSYPQYDTYVLALMQGSSGGLYTDITWFQLLENDTYWKSYKITSTKTNTNLTRNNAGGGLLSIYVVTNTTRPHIYIRYSYKQSHIYTAYVDAFYITTDITYDSDKALFIYTGYLHKGDTIDCDDVIKSYEYDGDVTTVENTKLSIPTDGMYKIITHVSDAYLYPSMVITDKNKFPVYMKAISNKDGTLDAYLLKGMKVNGNLVTESKRNTYGPYDTNRFSITMR